MTANTPTHTPAVTANTPTHTPARAVLAGSAMCQHHKVTHWGQDACLRPTATVYRAEDVQSCARPDTSALAHRQHNSQMIDGKPPATLLHRKGQQPQPTPHHTRHGRPILHYKYTFSQHHCQPLVFIRKCSSHHHPCSLNCLVCEIHQTQQPHTHSAPRPSAARPSSATKRRPQMYIRTAQTPAWQSSRRLPQTLPQTRWATPRGR